MREPGGTAGVVPSLEASGKRRSPETRRRLRGASATSKMKCGLWVHSISPRPDGAMENGPGEDTRTTFRETHSGRVRPELGRVLALSRSRMKSWDAIRRPWVRSEETRANIRCPSPWGLGAPHALSCQPPEAEAPRRITTVRLHMAPLWKRKVRPKRERKSHAQTRCRLSPPRASKPASKSWSQPRGSRRRAKVVRRKVIAPGICHTTSFTLSTPISEGPPFPAILRPRGAASCWKDGRRRVAVKPAEPHDNPLLKHLSLYAGNAEYFH